MATDFDIAVCGAGPVGMALAALLARRGVPPARIALIDARTVEHASQDPRSIALSYGSRQILEDIGAWHAACTPIHQIHVSRRGQFGRTMIDRDEYRLPALGYVARYGAVVGALAASPAIREIAALRPAQAVSFDEQADQVELSLADGRRLTTQILVQAEGGLFGNQTVKPLTRDYLQTAVIARVTAVVPIAHRAFERFTDEGPLALLPQEDAQGSAYALVWCVRPDTATRLALLPDAAFLLELRQAFGDRLGKFTGTGPRHTYPLGLNAGADGTARTVAIGNAAQTLHPVAGQGLNLGLRDALVLAQLLGKETSPAMLTRYRAERRTDRNLTVRVTDTLARMFAAAPDGALPQSLLGLSLGVVDALPPAKRLLAEQMMFGWR